MGDSAFIAMVESLRKWFPICPDSSNSWGPNQNLRRWKFACFWWWSGLVCSAQFAAELSIYTKLPPVNDGHLWTWSDFTQKSGAYDLFWLLLCVVASGLPSWWVVLESGNFNTQLYLDQLKIGFYMTPTFPLLSLLVFSPLLGVLLVLTLSLIHIS